jgi:hypothetical protein
VTPADALAIHQAQINENGQAVSIRRYTGTGPSRTSADTATVGYVRNYGSNELIGSISQGDQVAVVLIDTLSGILPVTTSDKLVVGTKEFAIKNPMKRVVGGTLIALEIHAAGFG